MKTPYLIAPLYAFALLFSAQTTSGQELQRSMVYHATPQQIAAERAAAQQQQSAHPVTARENETQAQSRPQPSRVRAANVEQMQAAHILAPHTAPHATVTTTTQTKAGEHTVDAPRAVTARRNSAATPHAAPVVVRIASAPKTDHAFDSKPSPPSRKKLDKWFLLSSAIFATGTIMDHASTVSALRKEGAREGNPLLRNSDGGFSAGKHLALSGGIYGVSLLLQRKHPRAANILRIIGGAAKIGIAVRNTSAASGRPDALPR